jgi:trehalose 6-phosphate phosphatase
MMKHWQRAISDMQVSVVNSPRLGLITDVDGTISRIVADPDKAVVTPGIRALLKRLMTHLALVAVVSGRSVADLRARLDLPGLVYVGNHGFERWRDNQIEVAPEAQAHRPALEAALEALRDQQQPGMLIEDKGATISVHYRQTTDPEAVKAAFLPIADQIAKQHSLNLFHGRMVFELRPPVEINKGIALEQLITQYHLDAAIYMGDDTTDADAMLMARQLRQDGRCKALGLAVVSEDTPYVVRDSADLFLDDVADVEGFLAWLVKARTASPS